MKQTLNAFAFALLCLSVMAFSYNVPNLEVNANVPNEIITIYQSDQVHFSVEQSLTPLFVSAQQTDDFFNIKTAEVITFVQVKNDLGELEFQLPIQTDELNVSMEDFTTGSYEISFQFESDINNALAHLDVL